MRSLLDKTSKLVFYHTLVQILVQVTCPDPNMQLQLNNKNLTAVPTGLNMSVEILNLASNRIQTLGPDSFPGLSGLVELDISSNELIFIDDAAFKSLTSLVKLSLDNNLLTALPATLGPNTAALSILSVSHNNLTAIRDGYFSQMQSLKMLKMEFCGLVALPDDFFIGLEKLRELTMGGQAPANLSYRLPSLDTLRINTFQGYHYPFEFFRDLKSLETFVISGPVSHYGIPSFPESVSMVTIQAPQNIETIGDLSHMAHLHSLTFLDAAFECDQRLCWTSFEIYTFDPSLVKVAPCKSPPYAAGKDLLQMTKLELRCFENPVYADHFHKVWAPLNMTSGTTQYDRVWTMEDLKEVLLETQCRSAIQCALSCVAESPKCVGWEVAERQSGGLNCVLLARIE